MAFWLSGSSSDSGATNSKMLMPASDQPCDLRHGGEFGLRLGEGDVDPFLPEPLALQEPPQGQRRLPGAGVPLDQVDPVRREAAAQNVIKPRDARRDQGWDGFVVRLNHGHSLEEKGR